MSSPEQTITNENVVKIIIRLLQRKSTIESRTFQSSLYTEIYAYETLLKQKKKKIQFLLIEFTFISHIHRNTSHIRTS